MSDSEEKSPENVSLTPKSPACSYCGDIMNFTVARVKRPVPPGAVDLNIYDETSYWQCRQCKNISTECLRTCTCGRQIINFPEVGRRLHRELPPQQILENRDGGLYGYIYTYSNYRDDMFGYNCIYCARCRQCGTVLQTNRFVVTYTFSEHNKSEQTLHPYHEHCFTTRQNFVEQVERQEQQKKRERVAIGRAARWMKIAVKWAIIFYLIAGMYAYSKGTSESSLLEAFTHEALLTPIIIIALGLLIAALTTILSRRGKA